MSMRSKGIATVAFVALAFTVAAQDAADPGAPNPVAQASAAPVVVVPAAEASALDAQVVDAAGTGPAATEVNDATVPQRETPAAETQTVEQQLAGLERDLAILEEDLLYPSSSRVAVYLSMDVGELFGLDEVELKLNGTTVAHHLYTERQTDALHRGGVQRLFVGNARQGSNELTAFFLGRSQDGRELRRATTKTFTKAFEPLFVELHIADSETLQRPEFSVEVH